MRGGRSQKKGYFVYWKTKGISVLDENGNPKFFPPELIYIDSAAGLLPIQGTKPKDIEEKIILVTRLEESSEFRGELRTLNLIPKVNSGPNVFLNLCYFYLRELLGHPDEIQSSQKEVESLENLALRLGRLPSNHPNEADMLAYVQKRGGASAVIARFQDLSALISLIEHEFAPAKAPLQHFLRSNSPFDQGN